MSSITLKAGRWWKRLLWRLPLIGRWFRRREAKRYVGHDIVVNGQRRTIVEFNPTTQVATIDTEWLNPPSPGQPFGDRGGGMSDSEFLQGLIDSGVPVPFGRYVIDKPLVLRQGACVCGSYFRCTHKGAAVVVPEGVTRYELSGNFFDGGGLSIGGSA